MSISSDEVNYLVYRYLLESGFTHSAFSFAHESLVARSVVSDTEVPPGALLSFLQKGLQYVEIETHLQEDGTERQCDEPFHLLAPHVCRVKPVSVVKPEDDSGAATAGSRSASGSAASSSGGIAADAIVPASDVTVLSGHRGEVFTCAFNPQRAELLATGSADGSGRIWDVSVRRAGSKGELCVSELKHAPGGGRGSAAAAAAAAEGGKDVASLDWSPDGARLATGCYDGRARIWGVESGLEAVLTGHTQPIFTCQWSPSGQYILTGSVDKTAIVWDAASGSLAQQFGHHAAPILDADWASDTMFATSSSDKTVNVWNVGDRAPVRTFVGHSDEVNALTWSPSKDLLATGSDDGTARLWSLTAGTDKDGCVGVLTGHKKAVYRVKWAPTGPGSTNASKAPLLATASFDSTVRLWDPATTRCRHTLAKHSATVYALGWSPSGDFVASGAGDRSVHVWSAKDGGLVRSFTAPSGVFDVAFNSTGDVLAVCCANGAVALVDLRL